MNKRARSGSLVTAEDAVAKADAIVSGPASEWEKDGFNIFKEVKEAYEEAREAARESKEDMATALLGVAKLAVAIAELQLKYAKSTDASRSKGQQIVVVQSNPRPR